jgi:hypothetical protein
MACMSNYTTLPPPPPQFIIIRPIHKCEILTLQSAFAIC